MSAVAGEDDELRALKEELRRRRANGERGWYIRNRRLINLNRGTKKKWTSKRKPSSSVDEELQNRLKEELKKKRENGESGWYIRKGKLIQRTSSLYYRSYYLDKIEQLNHGSPFLHSMANHHDETPGDPMSQGSIPTVLPNQPSRGMRSTEPAILRYNRWKKSQREEELNKNKQNSQTSDTKTDGTNSSVSAYDPLNISSRMDCKAARRSAEEEECREVRDQQSAEESYPSARRSKSFRQTLGPTKLFVAAFNPEDKLHDDTRYFRDGSSDDSDDDGGGVEYEDPTTLLLLGKTKQLMKLLQIYRKNTVDVHVKEGNQESSCSGKQDLKTYAGAHEGQPHVTSFERRLTNKLVPVGNPMMRIDGVTYMNILNSEEEKALMQHLIGEMCDKTYVSLTEVCHRVCNFCKNANILIPPEWKYSPIAAKEWVKAFVTHRQLFTFIPTPKEKSGKNYISAVKGSMTQKQAPNFYICDNGTMIHREALIETIQEEHDYIIPSDTQVIHVTNVNGGMQAEIVKEAEIVKQAEIVEQ